MYVFNYVCVCMHSMYVCMNSCYNSLSLSFSPQQLLLGRKYDFVNILKVCLWLNICNSLNTFENCTFVNLLQRKPMFWASLVGAVYFIDSSAWRVQWMPAHDVGGIKISLKKTMMVMRVIMLNKDR